MTSRVAERNTLLPIALGMTIAAVGTAGAVTIIELSSLRTQAWLNVACIVLVVLLGWLMTRNQFLGMLVPLRPHVVLLGSTAVVAVFAMGLPDDRAMRATGLLLAASLGSVAGVLFGAYLPAKQRRLSVRKSLARILFWMGAGAGIVFMFGAGIPVLQNDVEQARVDLAVTGSGYLRLLAYLTVPSAIAIWASQDRRRLLYALSSAVLVVGLGNRSPLLYLLIGCAVVVVSVRGYRAVSSLKLLAIGALTMLAVVGFGTYRIVTQDEFANYEEYRSALAEDDYVTVARVSFLHYAETVPSNAALVKELVDSGGLEPQFGATLFSAIVTALPGEQQTLDQKIRIASGKSFVGGGIPPTLAGEGYVNFLLPGSVAFGALMGLLVARTGRRFVVSEGVDDNTRAAAAAQYGYVLAWCLGGQVAGFTGASTFPIIGFFAVVLLIERSR